MKKLFAAFLAFLTLSLSGCGPKVMGGFVTANGAPHLLLRDDKGQPLVSLPEAPKGSAVK
jgi:hypothetical protein